MFYFPSLFRGNSFNAPATTDNKERNQSEEKTPPDTDYPEPLDPASLKKIAHMEDSKKLNLLKFKWKPEENFKFPSRNSRRYNPRDLVKAFSDARNTRTVIISKRTNEDFEKIFERARIVAQSVDCSLEIPRQVARQQHRANAPATTPCEYWRISLFFPFIDHLMTQFDERFPESSRNMYLGYYLIRKYLPQLDDEKLKAIRESYQADLPQFHSFEQELLRWRNMTRKFDVNDKYPLQTALKIADKEFSPNIHAILSSILTLPVGSVCCERSFSSLRRLKTWERSTMGQECLCGLALLHIHKDKVDSTEGFNERVLKRWDATGHRKIGKLWNKEQENSE